MFVEGLHIYRMQTEQRNINYGAMRFYYAIGWGVPAIITGSVETQAGLASARRFHGAKRRLPQDLHRHMRHVRSEPGWLWR